MSNTTIDEKWNALMKAMETDHADDWAWTEGWGGQMPRCYRTTRNDEDPLVMRWNAYVRTLPQDIQARHAATRRLLDARSLDEMAKAISDGADVNAYSGNYKYPRLVLVAACMGENDKVRLLAEAGANLDIGSKHTADTALGVAAFQSRYETMHLLLELGADPNDDFVLTNLLGSVSVECW